MTDTKPQNTTNREKTHLFSLDIPQSIQNEWSRLFSKQLYGIGKDILHKDNLLLQYGFSRKRPPNPDKGSSQYSFSDQTGKIILWGFGMICATNNDGIFLERKAFGPKLLKMNSLLSNQWEPSQFSQCTLPKTKEENLLMLKLVIKSIKWMENYENWVLATCGHSYRNESLRGMSSRAVANISLDKKWSELYGKFVKIQFKKNVM